MLELVMPVVFNISIKKVWEICMSAPDPRCQRVAIIILLNEDSFFHSLIKGVVIFIGSNSDSDIHNGHESHAFIMDLLDVGSEV